MRRVAVPVRVGRMLTASRPALPIETIVPVGQKLHRIVRLLEHHSTEFARRHAFGVFDVVGWEGVEDAVRHGGDVCLPASAPHVAEVQVVVPHHDVSRHSADVIEPVEPVPVVCVCVRVCAYIGWRMSGVYASVCGCG